ncbi:hypothetical protein [Streptomyces qinglanensis]|uniref:hypothetical protein n=1 Tax=Streptomyces qinglanensis TaxID=943816 RepID=UPI003D71AEF6
MPLMAPLRRLISPLRHIDVKPDDLVAEAHLLLTYELPKHEGVWSAISAISAQANAKIALATYLRTYRDGN